MKDKTASSKRSRSQQFLSRGKQQEYSEQSLPRLPYQTTQTNDGSTLPSSNQEGKMYYPRPVILTSRQQHFIYGR